MQIFITLCPHIWRTWQCYSCCGFISSFLTCYASWHWWVRVLNTTVFLELLKYSDDLVYLKLAARIYLGMHSLTDVVAGIGFGIVILAFWLVVDDHVDAFIVSGKNGTSIHLSACVLQILEARKVWHWKLKSILTAFPLCTCSCNLLGRPFSIDVLCISEARIPYS